MGLIFLISFRFGQAPAGQVVTPVGIAGQPLKGEPWKRLGDLEMDPVTAAQGGVSQGQGPVTLGPTRDDACGLGESASRQDSQSDAGPEAEL